MGPNISLWDDKEFEKVCALCGRTNGQHYCETERRITCELLSKNPDADDFVWDHTYRDNEGRGYIDEDSITTAVLDPNTAFRIKRRLV